MFPPQFQLPLSRITPAPKSPTWLFTFCPMSDLSASQKSERVRSLPLGKPRPLPLSRSDTESVSTQNSVLRWTRTESLWAEPGCGGGRAGADLRWSSFFGQRAGPGRRSYSHCPPPAFLPGPQATCGVHHGPQEATLAQDPSFTTRAASGHRRSGRRELRGARCRSPSPPRASAPAGRATAAALGRPALQAAGMLLEVVRQRLELGDPSHDLAQTLAAPWQVERPSAPSRDPCRRRVEGPRAQASISLGAPGLPGGGRAGA